MQAGRSQNLASVGLTVLELEKYRRTFSGAELLCQFQHLPASVLKRWIVAVHRGRQTLLDRILRKKARVFTNR